MHRLRQDLHRYQDKADRTSAQLVDSADQMDALHEGIKEFQNQTQAIQDDLKNTIYNLRDKNQQLTAENIELRSKMDTG